MRSYPKFVGFSVLIVFVKLTASSNDQLQEPNISLAHVLGKEYILVQSDHNQDTVKEWNYSDCEIQHFYYVENDNYPFVIKLIENNGQFLLSAKVEWITYKFQADKEFICSRHNSNITCTVTLNGTILTMIGERAEMKMNFTAEEMQLDWFISPNSYIKGNASLTLNSKQSKNNSVSLCITDLKDTQSSTAPSLSAALGKEFVLKLSDQNKVEIEKLDLSQCTVDELLAKYPLGLKLTKINETYELTAVWNVYDTSFQLGKQTRDSRGTLSTFTLIGTTLTRVSHADDGSAVQTSVWKFGPDEVRYQEVKEDSNSTLTFKVRS